MDERMTREETKKILMIIQAAYPNYNPPDKTVTVNLWQEMFEEYPFHQVSSAITAYIKTNKSGFAPSVGDIIDRLQFLYGEKDINEMEAWRLVQKAMSNSGYHADEEFAKLPPAVRKAVVSPAALREWGMMDMDDRGWNVVASNFMRTYRAEVAREKEFARINHQLQNRIESHPKQKCIEHATDTDKEENCIHNGVPMSDRLKKKFLEAMEVKENERTTL